MRSGGRRTQRWAVDVTPEEFALLEGLRATGRLLLDSRADLLQTMALNHADAVLEEGARNAVEVQRLREAVVRTLNWVDRDANGGRPPRVRPAPSAVSPGPRP